MSSETAPAVAATADKTSVKGKKGEVKSKGPKFVTKEIGGEKNGGTRTVRVKRLVCLFSKVEMAL